MQDTAYGDRYTLETTIVSDAASVDVMPSELSTARLPAHVAKKLIGGTSALGASVVVERGAGFLANILAARLGGASTFGAYSLAITTANSISTYAAGGIGSTAARFSGKYPIGSSGYQTLTKVLVIVSVVSAALASCGLWLGAAPIAQLLHKESLTGLLRWAALSAVGIILLECARGFFVGQARHVALMLLSLIVGLGMITFIPLAATRHNPIHMIVSQGLIAMSAVVVCVLLSRPLGLRSPAVVRHEPLGPMLKEVWSFGFVQLAGLIGWNLAGWWLTTLVARSDTRLAQMSYFAIASQLRNIVALAPTLLTESSYAVMADRSDEDSRTPSHVMALCTYASTFGSLLLAALAIILLPWGLNAIYGRAYGAAATTTAIALAVAIVHMGNAPANARLSIVSIRSVGVINTVWALFVAGTATIFLLHNGSAARAMTIYLAGHVLSSILVLLVLAWKDRIPSAMVLVFSLACSTGIVLAGLAVLRDHHPAASPAITAAMVALSAAAVATLLYVGRTKRYLPSVSAVWTLLFPSRSRPTGIDSKDPGRNEDDI